MEYYQLSGEVLERTVTPYLQRTSGTRSSPSRGGFNWKPQTWEQIACRFFDIVYDAQLRGTSSKRRSKRILRRKIWANFVKGRTTFLTLTFKEDQTDYNAAYNELKKFFKRLSYHYGNKEKHGQNFAYVVVPEQQLKRGARTGKYVWHFHLMLFDVPFLPAKEVKKIWGNGFIKLNAVFGNPEHAGNYMMKYFVKSFSNVEYRRRYSCSQNLKKSYVTTSEWLDDNLRLLYNFETVYENSDGFFYYGRIRLTKRE